MIKKYFYKSIILFTSLLTLIGCGGTHSDSSSEYIASSLKEAINNTKDNYQMNIETGLDYSYPYQIIANDFYYYAPGEENYILLEEDPQFYHSFERTYLDVEETYRFGMDVHGRSGRLADKDALFATDFMDILTKYADDFSKFDEDSYTCSVKELAYELKNYFQNRAFSYANYFEIDLDKNGRLASFKSYEKNLDDAYLVGEVSFSKFNKQSFEAYDLWNKAGRKINLRIIDLKLGSFINNDQNDYRLFYENEEIEIEGIVASIDFNNNFIIASESDVTGYVGIQVSLKDTTALPSINDRVKVKGKIVQSNYVGRINEATYTFIKKETYHPTFDEEKIATSYGGGYYAAYLFASTPIYADSVYSTYAYISKLPSEISEHKDTIIEVICPKHVNENDVFHMEVILSSSMKLDKRKEIIDNLKQYGIYSKENNTALELSFSNFILRFNPNYYYHIQLEYGLESAISKSLTPSEKVEKMFGVTNFPFPEVDEYNCFTFGGSTGAYLEFSYGIEGKTVGLFYNVTSLATSKVESLLASLNSIGFELYDVINDANHDRHQIYKKDDVFVDILLADTTYEENSKTLYMWIYQGNLICMPSIESLLKENAPYFNSADFIRPDGVTSSNIGFYKLKNYAGLNFNEGEYLNCVTIDVNENNFSTLRQSYKNKGYSTYLTENSGIYSYTTRGATHYVLFKQIEGSNEKVFLDMAMYQSSDYTFSGHSEFTNRIEILIYKGEKPLSSHYEYDLNGFSSYIKKLNGFGEFSVNFTIEDTKVENYPALEDGEGYSYLYYGYYYEYNCFIYSSNLKTTFDDIIRGLEEAGYKLSTTTSKGNVTYEKASSNEGGYSYSSFVFIMKEYEKGYIRIMDGVGGLDY